MTAGRGTHELWPPGPAGPAELAHAPPRPWRLAGRLLVLDPSDRVLFLEVSDSMFPELGRWWEVPGGGVEPADGGDPLGPDDPSVTTAAAVRETAEETGVVVPAESIAAARWRLEATSVLAGQRAWGRHVVHVARLAVPPRTVRRQLTADELLVTSEPCWVPLAQVGGLGRTFPDGVAGALEALLAGRDVDGGTVVWC